MNVQSFRLPVDSAYTLWTEDAGLNPSGYGTVRIDMGYMLNPLVVEYEESDQEVAIIDNLVHTDLAAGITLDRFRLGAHVPLYLVSSGEVGGEGGGIGDIGADLKVNLIDPYASQARLGLALYGRFTLGTSSTELPLGAGGFGWEAGAIADKRVSDFLFAVNLATRGLPETDLGNVTLNDAFVYRLGVGYALSERSGLSADMAGVLTYSEALSNPAAVPAELLGGGWYRVTDNFVLRAGAGRGITSGIGSPDLRTLLVLGFEPPRERDRDGDGYLDSVDGCPDDPEDFDNHQDPDGCPDPSTMVRIQFQDEAGQPIAGVRSSFEGDAEGGEGGEGGEDWEIAVHPGGYTLAGVADDYLPFEGTVEVPAQATFDVVQVLLKDPASLRSTMVLYVQDESGAPIDAFRWRFDRDEDAQGAGGYHQGEVVAGSHVISVSATNYAAAQATIEFDEKKFVEVVVTLYPTLINVTADKIEIADKVYFDVARATIRPQSFELLDQVAAVLQELDRIMLVRIEGHTDNRGAAAYNKELSDRRAASVRDYMIGKGIDEGRLSSIGLGEEQPIDDREVAEAWDANRRVEFVIEKWSDEEVEQEVEPKEADVEVNTTDTLPARR